MEPTRYPSPTLYEQEEFSRVQEEQELNDEYEASSSGAEGEDDDYGHIPNDMPPPYGWSDDEEELLEAQGELESAASSSARPPTPYTETAGDLEVYEDICAHDALMDQLALEQVEKEKEVENEREGARRMHDE